MSQGRSARRRAGAFLLWLLAAGALLAPSAATAAVQGGAPPLQTGAPDVVSAGVVSSTQALLCFDAEVRSPADGLFGTAPLQGTSVIGVTLADRSAGFSESGAGGTYLRGIHLRNYGLTGSLVPPQPIIGNPIAAKAEGSCLRLFFLPIWGAGIADNTLIEVEPGAVQGADGRPNTPGAAALDGSTVTPLKGETTGPKLVRAVPNDQDRTITYVYAAPVLPMGPCGVGQAAPCTKGVTPYSFGYYTASNNPTGGRTGEAIVASAASSITVRFPAAGADAGPEQGTRFFSMPGAVVRNNPNGAYPSSFDVVGRTGGNGAASDRPDLQSATPVAGSPGVYDLRYDQSVVTPNPAPGILPGCLAVPENPMEKGVALNIPGVGMIGHSLGRPGSDTKTIRVSFTQIPGQKSAPGVEALQDTKIVRIVDVGDTAAIGCAIGLTSGLTSSAGEADVRTPPMQKGFTEGPDLTAVGVNRAAGTMTFVFDQLVAPGTWLRGHGVGAPAAGAPDVGSQIDPAGDVLNDASPSTSVTVRMRSDQLAAASGGMLLSGGGFGALPVTDGSNLAPENVVPFLGLPTSQFPSPGSPAVGDYTGAPALNQSAAAVPVATPAASSPAAPQVAAVTGTAAAAPASAPAPAATVQSSAATPQPASKAATTTKAKRKPAKRKKKH